MISLVLLLASYHMPRPAQVLVSMGTCFQFSVLSPVEMISHGHWINSWHDILIGPKCWPTALALSWVSLPLWWDLLLGEFPPWWNPGLWRVTVPRKPVSFCSRGKKREQIMNVQGTEGNKPQSLPSERPQFTRRQKCEQIKITATISRMLSICQALL